MYYLLGIHSKATIQQQQHHNNSSIQCCLLLWCRKWSENEFTCPSCGWLDRKRIGFCGFKEMINRLFPSDL